MRDRLIELLEEAHDSWLRYVDECAFNQTALSFSFEQMFADHLLSEGVIVPPCKVGDIVYTTHWHWGTYIRGEIMPYEITNITITQNKKGVWTKKYRAMEVVNGKTIDWQLNFAFDDIGKIVFLTRELAEEALERRGECE